MWESKLLELGVFEEARIEMGLRKREMRKQRGMRVVEKEDIVYSD